MAETATEIITIDAAPDEVWGIAIDLERYPEWARDIKAVTIHESDGEGRPSQVEFRTSALGRSTHYTLQYRYDDEPRQLGWSMIRGDIQRSIDGAFTFIPTPDGKTEVRYDLAIDLVIPLPGFVKRRAEVRILNTVRELKVRAEA
ncbi:MAG: SRPBCC family protein [Ilumatobacter sp.]|nr:SRPBCC family protein [bacterium]MDG1265541.1 SRPBCC family protein [Ilumatobacter sp.]MDG2041038.1 SRPBCC family protein [Ilumatobacter sp.]